MKPTIARPATDHVHCYRPEDVFKVFPGDVRRCPHGKIQLLIEGYGRMSGPGTRYWFTLHPLWAPLDYYRAKKALRQ